MAIGADSLISQQSLSSGWIGGTVNIPLPGGGDINLIGGAPVGGPVPGMLPKTVVPPSNTAIQANGVNFGVLVLIAIVAYLFLRA